VLFFVFVGGWLAWSWWEARPNRSSAKQD
jgi:hypothetical protein